MKYNFDEIVDRSKNNAAKYMELEKNFNTKDLIPAWVADMDFRVADEITQAIIDKAKQGIYGYTYRPDSYYKSYRDWQIKRNNFDFDINLFSHCVGVIPAMRIFINLFTNVGDKIVIQEPVYTPFRSIIENSDRVVLVNELVDNDAYYSIDFEDFENKIKEAKLFILCNPHNPIGRAWNEKEIQKMAEICKKYDVEVISDEVHSDLMLTTKHNIFRKYYKKTTTYIAASKTFNLAGLQAAVCIFHDKEMKDIYDKQLSILDIPRNNAFSIEAIEAAFNYGEQWLNELLVYLNDNADYVDNFIKENLPTFKMVKPEATYLCWIKTDLKVDEMDDFFYNKAKVAVIKGEKFSKSSKQYIRLNIACPRSVLVNIMENIKEAYNNKTTI